MTHKPQILIVDDHPTNIKVLSDLLIEYGFAVLVAKDGKNALQKLQRVTPDLILLDVLMPGIDGFETCQRLKAQENTKEIPVIFMTALSDAIDKIKGLTLGAVDYITKPLQHEEVIARINVHLQLRSLTKHLVAQNALLQDEIRSRTLAQTAQRLSEEKFAKVFRANPAAMAILTQANGRFVEINQSLAKLTGYAPEEILGKTMAELEFWPNSPDYCQQLLSQPEQWDRIELPIVTKAGEICYLLTSAEMIELAQMRFILLTAQDITRSKQAENALHDREARLSAIFDQLAVGLCYSDTHGNLLQANQKYQNLLGYTAAEIVQLTVKQVTHPDDFPLDQAKTAQLLAAEIASFSIEKRYLRRDGTPVWVNLTISPIRDVTGTLIMLCAVVEDIEARKRLETARQQAEAQLRQSTAKLRAAQRVAHVGDWEFDLISQKIIWSAELLLILGFDLTQPEPTFADFLQVFNDADRVPFQAWIEQSHQPSAPYYQADCQIVGRDGLMRYVEGRGQAQLNEQGQVIKLLGTVMDITERKQVEAALRMSEKRLQLVLEANNDGVWDWDIATNRTFRSQHWYQLIGCAAHEITDLNDEWSQRIHPDDRARVQATERAYLNRQTPTYVAEYRLQCQDGSYRWVESRGIAQWDEQDRPVRMIGSCRDISDNKRQASELQQARDAAEAANRAKSIFLANINHELRTPLTIILGCSELLNFDSTLTPQQKQRLASIDRSVHHLLDLINNVLELSKVEAGAANLELATVDLWDLLSNLQAMFLPQTAAKGLQLVMEQAADLPQFIQADERKLNQILINLLSNAVKFTAAGQVRLGAKVIAAPIATMLTLCFEVEDSGIGLTPAELGSIFEAFVQTEAGRKSHKGTGLGLSICRQFARLMQGDIAVQSTIGQGTQFALRLPVQLAQPTPLAALPPSTAREQLEQAHYRVLVVEDTHDMREILVHMLSVLGFEVREAVNGQVAVTLWQDWQPDLILMDMRMPVLDGYAATRQIRAAEQARCQQAVGLDAPAPTVIIAVTANVFAEDRPAILAAGCDDIVCKPFKEAELVAAIADRLGISPLAAPPRLMAADLTLPIPAASRISQLLETMPTTWVLELHRAALRLSVDRCQQLIEQIPADRLELSQVLIDLLENFRFDVMINLITLSPLSVTRYPLHWDD